VSYFQPPPAPPPPPEPHETPGWIGPPHNVLPGSFVLDEVLVQTDGVVVQVHTGRAYPQGFSFVFALILRDPQRDRRDPLFGARHGSGDSIRFGIQLSDGRKATNLEQPGFPGQEHPDVVLRQGGGGGNGYAWESNYWAWPTPPPGVFTFVVEWPSQGIPVTRTEIDAERIREASTQAKELWPRAEGGKSISSSVSRMSTVVFRAEAEGSDPGQTPDVA
jgi:hypothetical protein